MLKKLHLYLRKATVIYLKSTPHISLYDSVKTLLQSHRGSFIAIHIGPIHIGGQGMSECLRLHYPLYFSVIKVKINW